MRFLNNNFCDMIVKKTYKSISGPFADKIFTIIKVQQSKLDILIGDLRTTINKQKFFVQPYLVKKHDKNNNCKNHFLQSAELWLNSLFFILQIYKNSKIQQ